MTRSNFILFSIIFFSGVAVGQRDQSSSLPQNEFSFNATFLFQNMLAIVPNESELQSYIVQYKRFRPDQKTALRLGLGIYAEFQDSDSNVQLSRNSSDSNIRLRFGLERRIKASERLDFLIGADAFGQYSYKKVVTFVNPMTDTRQNQVLTGLSPVFGLSLKLGEFASITAETSFSMYYKYRKSETDTRDGAPPTVFETKSFSTSIDQPYGIYFGIKF